MKTELPKKNNATDGKKAHNDNKCIKVGRIRMNSWATKILKACDIVIYESELVHIKNKHNAELQKIGMTAFDFVKFICNNFNELRQGTNGTILLAVHRQHTSNIAAVEIHKLVTEEKIVYKINTATPINSKQLCLKKLLCANDH